ncbi:ABC transporter ATP-binding protein [Rhizobium binxianense]
METRSHNAGGLAETRAAPGALGDGTVLDVRGLSIGVAGPSGTLRLVDDVNFVVARGRTLCIVGESGSGKSLVALSLMRLLSKELSITGGRIALAGEDLLALPENAMRRVRGSGLSMIFQEPMTALNPAYTVGNQIMEAILAHRNLGAKEVRAEAVRLLREVNISAPEERLDVYPHQLSGGMRQRVMIALAIANSPSVLVADEPTTALDVTVQAQILELLRDLRAKVGAGVILITHDLGVVREIADDVLVLYAGKVMELAKAEDLFEDPQHPYTLGLLAAVPRGHAKEELTVIPGRVPQASEFPPGCRFSTRCALATAKCDSAPPPLREIRMGHHVACWYAPIEEHAEIGP